MAVGGWIFGERQGLASGDADLLGYDVHARHSFGHWVLNLHTGVDFEEGDSAVFGDDELDGAGAGVVNLGANCAGAFDNAGALLIGEIRCGCFLNELLEAALGRTIAGAKHGDIAVGIGKHLGFDVTWVGEEFLHVALCAPERFHCFAACGVESFLDVIEVVYDLQATSATAISCLNRNWKAVLFGEFAGFLPIIDGVRSTRRQRCADFFGDATGGNLIAKQLDGLWLRANPDHAGVCDRTGEIGVLRQEAVAWVNRVSAGARCDIEQRGDIHVSIRGGVAGQRVGFIGKLRVQSPSICFRVDGNGLNAQVTCDTGDAHGDFTAVGNENGLNGHECFP